MNPELHASLRRSHGGGIRAPFVVHWPARLRDRGRIRSQYHHVVDVVPTVLEVLGIEAPTRKVTQHYEVLGDRALWHRGWKVSAGGVAFAMRQQDLRIHRELRRRRRPPGG